MSKLLGHRVYGTGPSTVILLHEWLGDHRNWLPMLPYLSGRKARWVVADLRGYGWSERIKGKYTLDEAVGDVLALADHLTAPKVHLVGHSMGALVAQAVAAAAKSRVASLCLVCPVPASGFKADAETKKRMQKVLEGGKALHEAIHARTGNRYGEGFVGEKASIARHAAAKKAQLAYLEMFTGTDISKQVQNLKLPVRLIAGKYDLPFYQMKAQKPRFSKWYPKIDFAEILEAGHYPPLETPARLAGLIEEWIMSARTPTSRH